MANCNIAHHAKARVFKIAVRFSMCCRYKVVEKQKTFFIMNRFRLPTNTPMHMIHSETGSPSQFYYMADLHL